MLKIFYLTELLSPYRVEWMNRLCAKHCTVDGFYLYEREATRTDAWLRSVEPLFRTERMQTTLGGYLASGAFLRRIVGAYDVYIIDGYSSSVKLHTLRYLLGHGRKVFINIDGIDIHRARSGADCVKDRIKRRVFRSGAYFLCGSKLAADHIVLNGAAPERVFVHPFTSLHAADIMTAEQKQECQAAYKQKLGMTEPKIALAVGRFIPLKRYDCLIRAWQGMPDDCRLYLIGGGEERTNYEALITSLGIKNITLIDYLPPDRLADYYCAADLFVHPSETETWGLVLNEAMAKGCPVIATDRCVAGVELIRDGAEGYLTKVADEDDLREKMRRILDDDRLRESMSRNAIQRITPYTYENLAATHLRIFEDCSNKKERE